MAHPLRAPRVNNNDDIVSVVEIRVQEREAVQRGAIVAAVETDKAAVDVEADRDGYVLKILHQPEERVAVGSVLMWLGDSPDEAPPEAEADSSRSAVPVGRAQPTAKARLLLDQHGLDADQIPARGERLTVADIEAYLERKGSAAGRPAGDLRAAAGEPLPDVPGELRDLSAEARGMLTTVLWHRDRVAHGYLELEYDPQIWERHARAYAETQQLMLSPLLPLLAFRLVELARANPRLNATIVEGRRYQYRAVNLGFTVQAGETLYLAVVRDAQDLTAAQFINALGEVQRHAMAHKLRPDESTGATVAFSSMARWQVTRHVPLLPPQTALMVAHAAPLASGRAVLGASYDHRLLSGADVAQALRALAQPGG